MKFWVKAKGEKFEEQLLVSADSVEELKRSLELLLQVTIKHMSITDFHSQIIEKLSSGTSDIITVHVRTGTSTGSGGQQVAPSGDQLSVKDGGSTMTAAGATTATTAVAGGNNLTPSHGVALSMPSWGNYTFGSPETAATNHSDKQQELEHSFNGEGSRGPLVRTLSGSTLLHSSSNVNAAPSAASGLSSSRRGSGTAVIDVINSLEVTPAVDRICVRRDDLSLLLAPAFRGRFHTVAQGCFVRVRGALSLGTTASGYATVQIASVGNETQIGLDLIHVVEIRFVDAVSNSPPTGDEVRLWARHMLHAGRQMVTPMFIEAKRSALEEGLKQARSLLHSSPQPPLSTNVEGSRAASIGAPPQEPLRRGKEDPPLLPPTNLELDTTSPAGGPPVVPTSTLAHPQSLSKLRRRQTMMLQPNLFVPPSTDAQLQQHNMLLASAGVSPMQADSPPSGARSRLEQTTAVGCDSPTSGTSSPLHAASRSTSRAPHGDDDEGTSPTDDASKQTPQRHASLFAASETSNSSTTKETTPTNASTTKVQPSSSSLKQKFDSIHHTNQFTGLVAVGNLGEIAVNPPAPSGIPRNTAVPPSANAQSAFVPSPPRVPPAGLLSPPPCAYPIVKLNDVVENGWIVPIAREDETVTYAMFGTRHSNAKYKKARASDFAGFVLSLSGEPPMLSTEMDRDVTAKGFVMHGVPQLFRGMFMTLASTAFAYGATSDNAIESPASYVGGGQPDRRRGSGSEASNGYEFTVLTGRDITSLYNPTFRCQLPVPIWGAPMSTEKAAQSPQLVRHENALHVFYIVTMPTLANDAGGRRYGLAHAWTADSKLGSWTLQTPSSPITVTSPGCNSLPLFHISKDVEFHDASGGVDQLKESETEAPAHIPSTLVMIWCELNSPSAHKKGLPGVSPPRTGRATRRTSPSRRVSEECERMDAAPPTPPPMPPTTEFNSGARSSTAAVMVASSTVISGDFTTGPSAAAENGGVVKVMINHDDTWCAAAWTPHVASFADLLLGGGCYKETQVCTEPPSSDPAAGGSVHLNTLDEIRLSGSIRGVSLAMVRRAPHLLVVGDDRHRRGLAMLVPIELD